MRVVAPGRLKISVAAVGAAVIALLLLAGCGASASSVASSHSSTGNDGTGIGGSTSAPGPSGSPVAGSPQAYLIKTLRVNMAFSDTRAVAGDLTTWITNTDPKASTTSQDYEQARDNLYSVTITYSVQATLYPQIEAHLKGYAEQHGGKLLNLQESVQDITNDFVDAQSRLANLRAEQQRLQSLYSTTNDLNAILSIEQRLSDVEGQIEQIEARLSRFNGQLTFYTVTVSLQPIQTTSTALAASHFDPLQTLHDALQAAVIFGEWLLNVLIWLVVFSIFALPVLAVIIAVRRRRARRAPPPPPSMPAPVAAPRAPAAPPAAP
ncbi:MAG TPA: DUF4349 domain-containing protein [Ktedonobacterales bacterium]|nr:DUF4349 domain-containing protein [Ktedonobacterales bacterium]